jgi:hypothetical protein
MIFWICLSNLRQQKKKQTNGIASNKSFYPAKKQLTEGRDNAQNGRKYLKAAHLIKVNIQNR